MTRVLVLAGTLLVVVGLLWPLIQKLGLGRLPGDLTLRGEGWTFRFPLMTCLLISGIVTLALFLMRRVRW